MREMEMVGLSSSRQDHQARLGVIRQPWFTSPLHELVCALVACVARDTGIDIVFIKGPVLHAQGLRERQHSGDVDVWVEPSRLEDLLSALEPWGWRRQPDLWADTVVNHSRTLLPSTEWACEVDVHRRLPGIGVADQTAFSALIESGEPAEFAGVTATVPNREMSAVLSALHSMRPEIGIGIRPGGEGQAVSVLRLVGVDVMRSVAQLGAQYALQDALPKAFPDTHFSFESAVPARDWAWRQQPDRVRGYLVAWRSLPIRQRLKMVWRIIWPTQDLVWLSDSNAGGRSASIFSARVRRLLRGLNGSH